MYTKSCFLKARGCSNLLRYYDWSESFVFPFFIEEDGVPNFFKTTQPDTRKFASQKIYL